MPGEAVKRSTIYVAIGDTAEVYSSFAEVPRSLRKRIFGPRAFSTATLIIADRLGREELLRAARGESSRIRLRVLPEASAAAVQPKALKYLRVIAAVSALAAGAVITWLALSFH